MACFIPSPSRSRDSSGHKGTNKAVSYLSRLLRVPCSQPPTQSQGSWDFVTLMQGSICVMITFSRQSAERFSQNSVGREGRQKVKPDVLVPPQRPQTPTLLLCSGRQHQPLTLWEAAALTSASQSFIRFWKAGTRSVLVISGPTAFWSCRQKAGAVR